jgi:hypothetical protein
MRNALATVDSSASLTPRERAANDFYREPAWAVRALLDAEDFRGGCVWHPAAGLDNIPSTCRARDIHAFGSDLIDRGAVSVRAPLDFLDLDPSFAPHVEFIICNPPFALAEHFIERSLSIASRKVAMLLRLSFLEGQRRGEMFASTPLARVLVFSSRVSMPPGDSAAEAKGGAVAFAWYVWQHGHQGPPTLGWLRKPA